MRVQPAVTGKRGRRRHARREPAARDYERLAEWRHLVRRFLVFSEEQAVLHGLTARQHQALLAIKGFGRRTALTTGQLADYLVIQPHSAVGLVDRLVAKGLVRRVAATGDRRQVLLGLSARADQLISRLAAAHREELRELAPLLQKLLRHFAPPSGRPASRRARRRVGRSSTIISKRT